MLWGGKRDIVKTLPVNNQIRAREIRLVGANGEQLGIVSLSKALEVARSQGLDLVEVSPKAEPPVCRLLDYGRYKYEQAKKDREARKSQKTAILREIRIRPKIGEHDFESKARTTRKLLEAGDKVKVNIMFRGREITHPENGWKLLQKMVESVKDIALIEKQPMVEERRLSMVLTPSTTGQAKRKEAVKETQSAKT